MKNTVSVSSLMLAGCLSVNVYASDITDTYSAGDTLTATHMDNIKAAVNDNDTRLNAVETQTQPLSLGCSAGSAIRSIDASGNVTCEIDDNSGGDITSVTAGSGLSGGGTFGALTLSVPANGITSAHIVNESGLDYSTGTAGSPPVQVSSINVCYHISLNPTGSFTTLASVPVSNSDSGYVLFIAKGTVRINETSGWVSIGLNTGAPHTLDVGRTISRIDTASGYPATLSFSVQKVLPKSPGTAVMYLKACSSYASATTGDIHFDDLVAIYLPTQY